MRADLDQNGKPTNLQRHNHTVHVNIYSEEQACVTYVIAKIREEMETEDLVIVGPSGLVVYDQEGTRGNTFCVFSNFITTCLYQLPVLVSAMARNFVIVTKNKAAIFFISYA